MKKYTLAITLMNGHSINVRLDETEPAYSLVDRILSGPVVTVNQRSGESVYIFTDKVAYVTVYEEEVK